MRKIKGSQSSLSESNGRKQGQLSLGFDSVAPKPPQTKAEVRSFKNYVSNKKLHEVSEKILKHAESLSW